MADPLSICISAATAAKVLYQSSISLYSFVEGSVRVDQSMQALLHEFNSLRNIASAIGQSLDSATFRDQMWLDVNAQAIFAPLEESLKECNNLLQQFKAVIVEVRSTRFSANILRRPITKIRLDINIGSIVLLRSQMTFHVISMQLGLQTINVSVVIECVSCN